MNNTPHTIMQHLAEVKEDIIFINGQALRPATDEDVRRVAEEGRESR